QGGLQTGHQQRGGDSFAGNVGDGDGHVRRAGLNEVVVIATDRARRSANSLDFDSWNRRQGAGKELVLHFAGDGDFILQALALVLFLDQRADRAGHLIKESARTPSWSMRST